MKKVTVETLKKESKKKDKEISDLKKRIKKLEAKKAPKDDIPPQPKRVLNSKGEPVVYDHAEVVEILKTGPKSPDHKHCLMSDQTTKMVPDSVLEQ